MDDFSGGFGHRRMDVREELGTFWDVDSTYMPDLTRQGHWTLPPEQGTVTIAGGNPTTHNATIRTPSYPSINAAGARQLVGIGSAIYGSTDGLTFTRVDAGGADAAEVSSIVEFIDRDATVRHYAFYASVTEALTGTARYRRSTDSGATWINGAADKVLHDGIFWDNKLLAANGRSIIFAVSPLGAEVWNIDDVNDAEFITSVPTGHIHFIGVAQSPWGEPAVYFTDEGNLYVLDFFARKHYKIDIGLGGLALTCMYNGMIASTDGWNVFLYNPGSATVRNIGFPRKSGVPPSLHATAGDRLIRYLFAHDAFLFAVVSSSTENLTYLYKYNGLGWQQWGSRLASTFSHIGFTAAFPPVGFMVRRRMYIAGAPTTTSAAVAMTFFAQPHLSHVPAVDIDNFGVSGPAFLTGWFDGGFSEIDGALLRMSIDALNLNSNENVMVEYQLDNNESGAWVQMVNSLNVASTFTSPTTILYFSSAFPKRGLMFRTVRFRITLRRGGNATRSPEVKALILVYLKKPSFRSSWKFRIDINRMLELDAAITFQVDGVAPTMANIWTKIQSLWNTQILIPLIVPNIEPSPGIDVMTADVPMSFDDFRNAVLGRGFLDLQVLEPVAR